jgi:hypothetical protein
LVDRWIGMLAAWLLGCSVVVAYERLRSLESSRGFTDYSLDLNPIVADCDMRLVSDRDVTDGQIPAFRCSLVFSECAVQIRSSVDEAV